MFHGEINYFYGHFPYVNKLPEGKWQHPSIFGRHENCDPRGANDSQAENIRIPLTYLTFIIAKPKHNSLFASLRTTCLKDGRTTRLREPVAAMPYQHASWRSSMWEKHGNLPLVI
jgi:hypothetical protein